MRMQMFAVKVVGGLKRARLSRGKGRGAAERGGYGKLQVKYRQGGRYRQNRQGEGEAERA